MSFSRLVPTTTEIRKHEEKINTRPAVSASRIPGHSQILPVDVAGGRRLRRWLGG